MSETTGDDVGPAETSLISPGGSAPGLELYELRSGAPSRVREPQRYLNVSAYERHA